MSIFTCALIFVFCAPLTFPCANYYVFFHHYTNEIDLCFCFDYFSPNPFSLYLIPCTAILSGPTRGPQTESFLSQSFLAFFTLIFPFLPGAPHATALTATRHTPERFSSRHLRSVPIHRVYLYNSCVTAGIRINSFSFLPIGGEITAKSSFPQSPIPRVDSGFTDWPETGENSFSLGNFSLRRYSLGENKVYSASSALICPGRNSI